MCGGAARQSTASQLGTEEAPTADRRARNDSAALAGGQHARRHPGAGRLDRAAATWAAARATRTQPFGGISHPNDTWCADFKGWFRTADGARCDPLTIADAH